MGYVLSFVAGMMAVASTHMKRPYSVIVAILAVLVGETSMFITLSN
jgi:membrane protein DedA with SNARE-associated domain